MSFNNLAIQPFQNFNNCHLKGLLCKKFNFAKTFSNNSFNKNNARNIYQYDVDFIQINNSLTC